MSQEQSSAPELLEYARNRMCYAVRAGSFMYGLNVQGSDVDILGCYVDTLEGSLGFTDFQHVRNLEPDESYKNIRDFAKHLANGSSYWVETLFAPEDCIVTWHSAFNPFINNRNAFLTKALITKSMGFIDGMARRSKNGFDQNSNKQLSHSLRVGYMTLNWLNTGEYNVRMPQYRTELLEVKTGNHDAEQTIEKALSMHSDIVAHLEKSQLPTTINPEFLNHLIAEASMNYWTSTGEL